MTTNSGGDEAGVIEGEFFTDGAKYVMRLKGLPISGVGSSLQAAFDDLMRAQAAAGDMPAKLRELARDQQGEQVRATLIRAVATWLIALTLIGGLAAGMVAVSPKIAEDIANATARVMSAPTTDSSTPSEANGPSSSP